MSTKCQRNLTYREILSRFGVDDESLELCKGCENFKYKNGELICDKRLLSQEEEDENQ